MSTGEVNGPDSPADTDEAPVAAVLAAAGRRQQPTDEQLARWRTHFEAQLAGVRARRRRTRLTTLAGACAASAVLVVGGWLAGGRLADPGPAPAPVAQVATAFGGNAAYLGSQRSSLQPGAQILAGQRVESGQRSGLGVAYLGADVRLDAATVVVFFDQRLELVRGRLYVDTGAGRPLSPAIRILTPHGEFSHAGTQFVVSVNADEVLGAVREGRIVLTAAAGPVILEAVRDHARMVMVGADGAVTRSDVAPTGRLWSWVLQSSPGLALAGRSAGEVLEWAAREQGRRLVYADERARRAAQAPLGGFGPPLGPHGALEEVVAMTGLRIAEPSPTELRVMVSEGDQDAH